MKPYFLLLALVFHSQAWSQVFSLWHEEDTWQYCNVTSVPFEATDATSFLANLGDVVQKLEEKPARVNLIYNRAGNYLGTFYDENSELKEPKGFIVPGLVSNNLALSITQSGVRAFKFNDPVQDLKTKAPSFIDLQGDKLVPAILEMSGVTKEMSLGERYSFAKSEAVRKMDYRNYLTGYYLFEGVAYSSKDGGNYLWGAGMRQLGFTYPEIKLGSELNGIFMTRSQNGQGFGIILFGDSDKDQMALSRGFYGDFGSVDVDKYYTSLMETAPENSNDAKALLEAWHLTGGKTPLNEQVLEKVLTRKDSSRKSLTKVLGVLNVKSPPLEGSAAILEKVIVSKDADYFTLEAAASTVVNAPFPMDQQALLGKIIDHPEASSSTLDDLEAKVKSSSMEAEKKKAILDALEKKKALLDQAR